MAAVTCSRLRNHNVTPQAARLNGIDVRTSGCGTQSCKLFLHLRPRYCTQSLGRYWSQPCQHARCFIQRVSIDHQLSRCAHSRRGIYSLEKGWALSCRDQHIGDALLTEGWRGGMASIHKVHGAHVDTAMSILRVSGVHPNPPSKLGPLINKEQGNSANRKVQPDLKTQINKTSKH